MMICDYSDIKKRILRSAEAISDDFNFHAFSRICLIGVGAYFNSHAIQIAQKIPGFYDIASVIVASRDSSNEKIIRRRIADGDNKVEIISYDDFLEKNDHLCEPCLIIDFNTSLGGKLYAKRLATKNTQVIDAQQALYHSGGSNVYLSLREERRYVLDHLDSYFQILPFFADEYSRKVLIARLMSYAELDRRHLLAVRTPDVRFSSFKTSNYSLSVSDDEVYADIGAAHGDTVLDFYQVSRGNYNAIHAFEPDSENFRRLSTTCQLMPNAFAHFAGVGDSKGQATFHENQANRLGSNFLTIQPRDENESTVPILTIDDVLPNATLLKIDVEGFERRVIAGGQKTIRANKPKIHISGYHYPQDIPELIEAINSIAKYKSVALRHSSASLYDSNLLFSDEQSFGD